MSVVFSVLLAGLSPVQASGAASPAEPSKEQKICRRSQSTGSRLRAPKTCRTPAEWAEIEEAARRDADAARTISRAR